VFSRRFPVLYLSQKQHFLVWDVSIQVYSAVFVFDQVCLSLADSWRLHTWQRERSRSSAPQSRPRALRVQQTLFRKRPRVCGRNRVRRPIYPCDLDAPCMPSLRYHAKWSKKRRVDTFRGIGSALIRPPGSVQSLMGQMISDQNNAFCLW
jgi:hypothetical protein